mmetsp:Transcript_39772/g.118377  ORF Transcript_39772/g.118377 Transcript_39772/m.118377 type:complete len:206 (-) Transcript_39772:683-1300(-)
MLTNIKSVNVESAIRWIRLHRSSFCLSHWCKVRVRHCLLTGDPLHVIIPQHLVQQIDRLCRHQVLVLGSHKLGPGLASVAAQLVFQHTVQLNAVRVQVVKQRVGTQHACNLHQLIVVVMSEEKRLSLEDDCSHHTSEAPHVERVVIQLVVNQQLRSLKIARCHTHVVFATREVELSKTPVDEAKLPLLMVNHHIVRFYITMHDAH